MVEANFPFGVNGKQFKLKTELVLSSPCGGQHTFVFYGAYKQWPRRSVFSRRRVLERFLYVARHGKMADWSRSPQ